MMGEFTKDIVDIEMAAHGGTVIEIRKQNGKWTPVLDGKMNRRLHVGTEMALTGPAAGHDRLKTNADPSGTKVFGTLNNCAGGVTPWGTWLMAEENFHGYFVGELPEGHPETANYKRYGAPAGWYNWGTHHDRFDVSKNPTNPTASAGWSRSTRWIPTRCRRSAPHWAA
jgi:secreted PhoX family phosphatase